MGSAWGSQTWQPEKCAGGCGRAGVFGKGTYPTAGHYCSDECAEAHAPTVDAERARWRDRRDRIERASESRLPWVLVRPRDLEAALSREPYSRWSLGPW